MKKEEKTNVMRVLDQKKIPYTPHIFDPSLAVAGKEVAALLGQNEAQCFKTLVTIANTKTYYVFCVPVEGELDLKAAARAVGVKSVEMIPQKDLFPLTGYVHGGCSPIGMKKQFATVIDESALEYDVIFLSGGKLGHQIEIAPADLSKVIRYTTASVSK